MDVGTVCMVGMCSPKSGDCDWCRPEAFREGVRSAQKCSHSISEESCRPEVRRAEASEGPPEVVHHKFERTHVGPKSVDSVRQPRGGIRRSQGSRRSGIARGLGFTWPRHRARDCRLA